MKRFKSTLCGITALLFTVSLLQFKTVKAAEGVAATINIDQTKVYQTIDDLAAGNYVWHFANTEDKVGDAVFQGLNPKSIRTDLMLDKWEPTKGNYVKDPLILKGLEQMKSFSKNGAKTLIATIWEAPDWMVTNPKQSTQRIISKDSYDEAIKAICDWLEFAKKDYGLKFDYISFNECLPNGGYNVYFDTPNFIEFAKKANIKFKKNGINTKWLIGDTYNARSVLGHAKQIYADEVLRPYLGPLSFHSWDPDSQDYVYTEIRDFAKQNNLKVINAEAGYDANAWANPKTFETWGNAVELMRMYDRTIALAGVESTYYWQCLNNYNLISADGKTPYPAFYSIRDINKYVGRGYRVVDAKISNPKINVIAAKKGNEFVLHVVNDSSYTGYTTTISGMPNGTYYQLRSSENERTRRIAEYTVTDGKLTVPIISSSVNIFTTSKEALQETTDKLPEIPAPPTDENPNLIVDECNDFNKSYSHDNAMNIGNWDAQKFGTDTGRFSKGADSALSVVYSGPVGKTITGVDVEYWINAYKGVALEIYTSNDNVRYNKITTQTQIPNPMNWSDYKKFDYNEAFLEGVKYVKLTMPQNEAGTSWAEAIGKVSLQMAGVAIVDPEKDFGMSNECLTKDTGDLKNLSSYLNVAVDKSTPQFFENDITRYVSTGDDANIVYAKSTLKDLYSFEMTTFINSDLISGDFKFYGSADKSNYYEIAATTSNEVGGSGGYQKVVYRSSTITQGTKYLKLVFPKNNGEVAGAQISRVSLEYIDGTDTKIVRPSPQMAEVTKGTPVIDGEIDSVWDKAVTLNVNKFKIGESGATGTFKLLWDEKNLYVLGNIVDPILSKTGGKLWDQDSVEFYIDENFGRTTFYENDDRLYRIRYDNYKSGAADVDNLKSMTKLVSGGYLLEVAIPLNYVTLSSGKNIGFDIGINDASAEIRTSAATFNDIENVGWYDTSSFGILKMVDTMNP